MLLRDTADEPLALLREDDRVVLLLLTVPELREVDDSLFLTSDDRVAERPEAFVLDELRASELFRDEELLPEPRNPLEFSRVLALLLRSDAALLRMVEAFELRPLPASDDR